jgi:hypothetical protein
MQSRMLAGTRTSEGRSSPIHTAWQAWTTGLNALTWWSDEGVHWFNCGRLVAWSHKSVLPLLLSWELTEPKWRRQFLTVQASWHFCPHDHRSSSLGRHGHKWKRNIKPVLKVVVAGSVDWFQLAYNSIQWQNLTDRVKNFPWIPVDQFSSNC